MNVLQVTSLRRDERTVMSYEGETCVIGTMLTKGLIRRFVQVSLLFVLLGLLPILLVGVYQRVDALIRQILIPICMPKQASRPQPRT